MTPFPIPGMTVHPDTCNGAEPSADWPGFRGAVGWALMNPACHARYTMDTGILFTQAVSTEDKRTQAAAFAGFADWVAVKIWGVEE
jgi:hypothetical protein